jgi:hypothetical protein
MKYVNPILMVPYIGMADVPDENGNVTTRNWLKLSFRGNTDHRAIKRRVRTALRVHLERRVHTSELLGVINWKRITHDGLITR